MKRLLTWLVPLALLGSVRATTFSPLTLQQQAKKADVIVQATIGTPTTATEDGLTYAVYPLKVSTTLAGDPAQLPQVAGGPALYILANLDAAPVFQAGQEAVLLLYKGRLDCPLVGFNQGVYWLINGQIVTAQAATGLPGTGQPVPGQPSTVQPTASQPAAGQPGPVPSGGVPSVPAVRPPGEAPTLPATSTQPGTAPTLPATQPETAPAPPVAQPAGGLQNSSGYKTADELKAAIVAARAGK
ncbi:hypothetical protein MF271_06920 [Deinococcus sp. KNUC1210]|uniref:hypothetical protein n=1 Tax=Deinococcus sp. KNUC1210 TaxID=2917691 RepID=UPI001EEF9D53|nr:hypothetical protein [Deinococcus sp. KNUC1210]ULH16946.1 hypothetical protein MF271_06920 [Deinococcus sp. KNUC1210]